MDADSFIVYVKTEDIYKGIVDYIGKRFDNSNFEIDRPLPYGKKNNRIS